MGRKGNSILRSGREGQANGVEWVENRVYTRNWNEWMLIRWWWWWWMRIESHYWLLTNHSISLLLCWVKVDHYLQYFNHIYHINWLLFMPFLTILCKIVSKNNMDFFRGQIYSCINSIIYIIKYIIHLGEKRNLSPLLDVVYVLDKLHFCVKTYKSHVIYTRKTMCKILS